MATSNNDRISSAKLATFAAKLWAKIKGTFLSKDSPAGQIFELPYNSKDYSINDLRQLASEGKTIRCVIADGIRLTLYYIGPGPGNIDVAKFIGPCIPDASGGSAYSATMNSNKDWTGGTTHSQYSWSDLIGSQPAPIAHSHNAVDIVNVNLSGMTTTIAAEIKARYPAQYIRMSTNSNGDASNISDKPKSGWSFFAEASLVKNGGSDDYTYIVHAYSAMRKSASDSTNVADTNGYVCEVGPGTSSCLWGRMLEPSEVAYEEVGSDTQIPVITTNKYGQIVEMHTVTVKGGGGGSDPGSTYAKLASYNTFTQTQEIKRTGSTKAQIIIRNDLRDLRIGVDANGQFYLEDYADRSYSPSSNFSFMETIGAGNDTQYLFHGQADTANKLNAAYNVGDFERPVYFENGIPRPCLVGFKINEMATTGNYISFV